MTISEISGMLDSAIKDISAKTITLDMAKKNLDIATQAHSDAVKKALVLRNQLNDEFDAVLPSQGSRIRGAA